MTIEAYDDTGAIHTNLPENKPIKVILIPPEPWQPERDNYISGREPNPFAIYDVLAQQNIEVTLFDPHRKPVNPFYGLHPIYMGLDPVRALKLLIAARKVDLIISVFETSCVIPIVLRRLFGYAPKIAIWDIVPEENWLPRKILQGISVPRVDAVFLLSQFHKEYIAERWMQSGVVVGQHIDTSFFVPGSPKSDGPILAIGDDVGRDFETFVEAVSGLDVEVIVKTRRPLKISQHAIARFTQIPHRLSFLELRDLYAMASMVVVPLHQTLNASGVGSILEALAMGKPLVVSDNPPIRDYLAPDRTCAVVPVGDAIAMRDTIEALRRDPARMVAMGEAGREFVEANFSNPAFAKRLASEIRKAVGGEGDWQPSRT